MTKNSYIKLSGILLLIVATLVIGLAFFLPAMVDVNAYRDEILANLQTSLNRKVTFSRGAFSWHFGPSFDFDSVTVQEPDNSAEFLKAKRITVRVALLPLLQKQVVMKDLIMEDAEVTLIRNSEGKLNIADLLAPAKGAEEIHFRKVQAIRSTFRWRDMAIQQEGISSVVRNITLSIDHLARGRKGNIKLSCEVLAASGAPAQILLNGSVRLPKEGTPLLDTELNGNINIIQAEIGRYWPYFGRFIPFGNSGGRLDLNTSFKGTPREFAAKGKIRVSGAAVTWPTVFHATLAPRSLQLEYNLKLTKQLLDIPSLELSTDGVRIKGSFQMQDYASPDPRIIAKAHTPGTFRYEDVRTYVPYGIIPVDTSDYIEHKIKSGVFKLDTGILNGRVSQIAHMERGDNYNTLLIRGPVEKAVLSYGPKAPVFSNIKGTLELMGSNFSLIGMSGLFGASPFKMQGSITEYNTDKLSLYPARMEITPASPDVAWLARIAGAAKLDFKGASTLVLNGSGPVQAYRLNGDWELKQAVYTFPGAIRKPSGMANHITFSSIIGKEETRLTSLTYSLAPLILSASAQLKYGEQPHLDFELQTNPFPLSDALPIMTGWQQFHPRGRVQAHIFGSGSPEDYSAMNYRGGITLNNFSFLPGARLKTVSGINGAINFQGNSLETSSMNAHYGDSFVNLKGKIRSLKHTEAEIMLVSPRLFLHDLNLGPAGSQLAINRMNAAVAIKAGSYTIKRLSGLINTSDINISGDYTGEGVPEANLTLTSSYLDLKDLLLLTKPSAQGTNVNQAPPKTGHNLRLHLKLIADAGKYDRTLFSRLNATLLQENGVLTVQGLEAGLFGGRMSAKGRMAPGNAQEHRYDLGFSLTKVDAERFFQSFGISREATGSLNLSGELSAVGASMADLKKTVSGTMQIKLEKGKLRKFNVLSKVLSILNFSQLLKFQLPDMVSGGMPYDEITGEIVVKDGIASSQDLFISSDAINMSIIGKADIVKEELDLTIGVQPLQTVDKIVNRIPVVGWLLKGKDNSLLTVFFEAKGPWSDPQVSAIPVKSMAKGVFNVFRRVFELPMRLFTDTGDVILGK
jgi:uncharacterized protein involved in outer membrane biogenesis